MIFRRLLLFASVLVVGMAASAFFINDSLEKRLLAEMEKFQDTLTTVQRQLNELAALTSPEQWQVTSSDTLFFCDLSYALADATFRERLQEELWFFYDKRGWLNLQYQRLGRYGRMINSVLIDEGLPRDLIYLFVQESGLNPMATSWAKARGLSQFILTTARRFNLEVNNIYDERCNPLKATQAACQYLKVLYSYFNDWLLALASYNHGETAVRSRLHKQQVASFIDLFVPAETYHYVFRIMALSYVYERKLMGDFSWLEQLPPLPKAEEKIISIKTVISLAKLSQQLGIDFHTFKSLNQHLKEILYPGRYPVNIPSAS